LLRRSGAAVPVCEMKGSIGVLLVLVA